MPTEQLDRCDISIHSLRMEGDNDRSALFGADPDFNPLPPHGGRHLLGRETETIPEFQSTPSAWRETDWNAGARYRDWAFQSTPSAWRETVFPSAF